MGTGISSTSNGIQDRARLGWSWRLRTQDPTASHHCKSGSAGGLPQIISLGLPHTQPRPYAVLEPYHALSAAVAENEPS